MSKKNTNTRELSERKIFSLIYYAYLEKYRNRKRYSVYFTDKEYGGSRKYYLKMNDYEIRTIKKLKDEDDGLNLEEKLINSGKERIVELLKNRVQEMYYDKDKYLIDDCDFNDFYIKSEVKVHLVKRRERVRLELNMYESTFYEMFKVHIRNRNEVSLNNMICKSNKTAIKILKHVTENYINDIYYSDLFAEDDYNLPFAIEMTDMQKITESIMNPRYDILGIYSENYNEMESFLKKYAIVPHSISFHYDYKKDTSIEGSFECFKFTMVYIAQWDGERGCRPIKDKVTVNANKVCDILHLRDYNELMKYCKEHYKTNNAVRNFRRDIEKICPEAIIY